MQKENMKNKRKRYIFDIRLWISLLTAVAVSMSAAAAASSVIVLATVVHLWPYPQSGCGTSSVYRSGYDSLRYKATGDGVPREEAAASGVLITAVACDVADYSEEAVYLAEAIHQRCTAADVRDAEAEGTCDAAENVSGADSSSILRDIRRAEQETVLAPAGYIDVGNRTSLMYDIGNQSNAAAIVICLTGNAANVIQQGYATASEQALWSLCKSLGYTDAGAAAVLGNLAMESGLNPAAKTSNFDYEAGLGGGGLAGWMCRGRFRGLMALAEKNGLPWTDLSLQMSYLQYELEHTRKHVGDEMKVQTDVEGAADYFCVYFEGCIGRSHAPDIDGISTINGEWYQGLAKRKALARAYYEKYADH